MRKKLKLHTRGKRTKIKIKAKHTNILFLFTHLVSDFIR